MLMRYPHKLTGSIVCLNTANEVQFSVLEYFSLVCSVTLKKNILFHGINKRGSREDENKEKHLKKIKVYNHEK